jgi:hypothetical protein
MYIGFHVKYPLFLSDFNLTWIFWTDLHKNPQISNFIEIHPVGAELHHEDGQIDGQTDMTKLIVAFCNFPNAPEKIVYEFLLLWEFGSL